MSVSTYRFLAMYILIGLVITMITAASANTADVRNAYDLNTEGRISEISTTQEGIWQDSETLVRSNQFAISNQFGDERSLGQSFGSILISKGLIPSGFISDSELPYATETELTANKIVVWIRLIILIFASYELFQIVFKPKTT